MKPVPALLLPVVALLATMASATPNGRFAPRDQCAADPAAASFRATLADAVRRRDTMLIARLAESDIGLDFGGGAGREEFLKRLQGAGEGSWADLAEVLRLGCALEGDRLTMPWLFAQHAFTDPYASLVVTGNRVALRAAPRPDATVLARLDWEGVEIVGGYAPEQRYQHVSFGKRSGWIATAYLRSPIGYRLIATREPNGPFRIAMCIAGD